MSHELRTPLNSVIGFSRVILKGIDGPINETQEQDITAIYNSGMHLLNMINEILDLSKIEAGKMELQLDDVNVTDVINSAITTAAGLVKDRPIELIQKVPANLPTIRADEIRLSQVLINLISNAVKFTDKGSIIVEATLQTNSQNKPEILVTVKDTGIGIAPQDQIKLFQRFSQVDDSPTRKTGGTGLGLSISRSLIEMHGGKIGLLSSEVGVGSIFYFTIPAPESSQTMNLDHLINGENIILSIDDDSQIISLYERFLKPHGYEVVALTDPTLAVERAREIRPFAITLDIMMPGKDGWQVLQELKKHEDTRDIPVMICSILQEENKGFNLGASDYLVKPFLQDDLTCAIQRLNKNGEIHEVLIINDDHSDLEALKKMVEETGNFLVVLADGGMAAIQLLKDFTPDIIILDLFMPEVNGFDVMEKIKVEPRLNRIPLIVLTGTELESDQQKFLSEFGHEALTKVSQNESDLLRNLQQNLNKIRPTRLVN
jgi:CheY-like chemotaxis protein/two-component sensor histidine kinase